MFSFPLVGQVRKGQRLVMIEFVDGIFDLNCIEVFLWQFDLCHPSYVSPRYGDRL
jgi:hypothetical protein